MAVNSGTSYEEEDLLVRERTLGMGTSQQQQRYELWWRGDEKVKQNPHLCGGFLRCLASHRNVVVGNVHVLQCVAGGSVSGSLLVSDSVVDPRN